METRGRQAAPSRSKGAIVVSLTAVLTVAAVVAQGSTQLIRVPGGAAPATASTAFGVYVLALPQIQVAMASGDAATVYFPSWPRPTMSEHS